MFARDISATTKHHNSRKPSRGGKDRRVFSKSSDKTRVENSRKNPMRGGYRL